MLFAIRPNLPQSQVFDGLNRFLRELLLATLEGRPVDETVLPDGLCAAIAGNEPTQTAVHALEVALAALDHVQKDTLKNALDLNTDPCRFLSDRAVPLPAIPERVFSPLKKLAVHLFQRTAKLKGIEQACGECIDDHYGRFRHRDDPGNGNVCCVCGTASLAQIQAGVADTEQWRGPYDHLLAKDLYPLYGVDPRNLLPICDTCNSKAKLAKDFLFNEDGNRRLAFSPWTECASFDEIKVRIDDTNGLFPRVDIDFNGADAARQEKLNTWDDVFKIKSRIEGEFSALEEKIAEDALAASDARFTERLLQVALAKKQAERLTPFNYWRARVYVAVHEMPPASREALRLAIASRVPTNQEVSALFNI